MNKERPAERQGRTAISSVGRGWRQNARKRIADVLIRAAYRLDPERSTVTTGPNGSYIVQVGDMSLARIEPGMIRETR